MNSGVDMGLNYKFGFGPAFRVAKSRSRFGALSNGAQCDWRFA